MWPFGFSLCLKLEKKNYNLIVDINDNLLDIEQNLIFVQYDFYER